MISNIDNPGGGTGQDPAPRPAVQETPAIAGNHALDTSNQFLVGAIGDEISFVPFANQGRCRLSRAQAVNLAAWLMVVADPSGEAFERVVKEIVGGK